MNVPKISKLRRISQSQGVGSKEHWGSFTKHAYSQMCAWNVRTNDFRNKTRFSKTFTKAAFEFDNTSSFNMGRIAKEVSGQILCFIGFVGICVCCGIPMWRVTSYIGANIVTGQIVWDGLWMNCVVQSTGQMQCKVQDSIMRLTQDLQAARALTVIAMVIGFIGMLLTFVGGQCSSFVCLIPVCWSSACTISDFQSVLTIETQKRELGASIYIGWGLLFGGIILCTSCPPREEMYPKYPGMYPYQGPMYGAVYTGAYVPNKPYLAPTYSPVPAQYL
uniref:Claudin f n=1 Tax=Sinocyclocheilus rhinocerous TaxID=307959 RepID=A0A673II16_9TELE